MSKPRNRNQSEHIRLIEDDDLLGIIGDNPPLFENTVKRVDALCTQRFNQ